jgi:hypothetical protein
MAGEDARPAGESTLRTTSRGEEVPHGVRVQVVLAERVLEAGQPLELAEQQHGTVRPVVQAVREPRGHAVLASRAAIGLVHPGQAGLRRQAGARALEPLVGCSVFAKPKALSTVVS